MATSVGFVLPDREPCPYCQNLDGEDSPDFGPCAVVIDDHLTRTFVNVGALGGCPGHLLVIPRRHVPTIFDLTAQEEQALMTAVMRASRAVHAVLQPDGLTIQQRNGIAAEQTVPHVHFHVVPRIHGIPFPPEKLIHATPYPDRQELADRLGTYIESMARDRDC